MLLVMCSKAALLLTSFIGRPVQLHRKATGTDRQSPGDVNVILLLLLGMMAGSFEGVCPLCFRGDLRSAETDTQGPRKASESCSSGLSCNESSTPGWPDVHTKLPWHSRSSKLRVLVCFGQIAAGHSHQSGLSRWDIRLTDRGLI